MMRSQIGKERNAMAAAEEHPEDEQGGHGPVNKLGAEVAAQMEAIEQDFGDDYEIGTVITIVEVITSNGPGIRVRCSAPPWTGIGMLRIAEKMIEAQAGD
jgi:hypothetical protein